ncbi:hypothetical protein BLNAU_5256 [Blattamonas nauphoetae]|uniref:Uncharacterized protein n=1 Tax=Blattamonas nauphoetae TaxID=2049346 RepID=A0ABQ9Y7R3_9EUKA|nr:hypothetical protein BLNAU_5256 [Blattamonas nauphoetae]
MERQLWKSVHRILTKEGFEDLMEKKLQHDLLLCPSLRHKTPINHKTNEPCLAFLHSSPTRDADDSANVPQHPAIADLKRIDDDSARDENRLGDNASSSSERMNANTSSSEGRKTVSHQANPLFFDEEGSHQRLDLMGTMSKLLSMPTLRDGLHLPLIELGSDESKYGSSVDLTELTRGWNFVSCPTKLFASSLCIFDLVINHPLSMKKTTNCGNQTRYQPNAGIMDEQ